MTHYFDFFNFPTLPRLRQIAVTAWQIPDAVHTVICAPDNVWWYHPKHVEQFPDKINCVKLHLVGYILEHYFDLPLFVYRQEFRWTNSDAILINYYKKSCWFSPFVTRKLPPAEQGRFYDSPGLPLLLGGVPLPLPFPDLYHKSWKTRTQTNRLQTFFVDCTQINERLPYPPSPKPDRYHGFLKQLRSGGLPTRAAKSHTSLW